MTLPARVTILEVGPRDGLQNEARPVPTADKVAFVMALVAAGLRHVEVTSFVHPRAVPQLADAGEVFARLPRAPGVELSALVPNLHGLRRAIGAGVRRIAVFTAASETFARRNINMSVEKSLEVFTEVAREARANGITVRAYVSTAFVCPYEGEVPAERVVAIAHRLLDMGADTVAIGDTIGAASPRDVERMLEAILPSTGADRVALHAHDTYGRALANVYAALRMGITSFDAAAGGLGGCPYAPGAAGNLATEDLVSMLHRMGIETGVDLDKLFAASTIVARALGRDLPGKEYQRLRSLHGMGGA
jgi:hydroxymethylglutaryl-CoA lyase